MEKAPTPRVYRYFDLVMALFVTVLIVSNIASSAKIVDWGVSLFGLPLAFDAGTILFPISYIFGDVLTEVYGFKRSRRVIWTGFGCLALTALTLWLVRVMPGEPPGRLKPDKPLLTTSWVVSAQAAWFGQPDSIPGG